MAIYKFRYHSSDNFDHRKKDKEQKYYYRNKMEVYSDFNENRNDTRDYQHGKTRSEFYASDFGRSETPSPTPPRRHRGYRHRSMEKGNYNHHKPHIHYITARSEPPLSYGSPRHSRRQEVVILKTRPDTQHEPRIAVYDRRRRRKRRSDCVFHSCPEKSSKAIPSMHYDELRCPHCAAHVQPSQEEVLAYPWSVQSYRPTHAFSNSQKQPRTEKIDLNKGPLPPISPTKDQIIEHGSIFSQRAQNSALPGSVTQATKPGTHLTRTQAPNLEPGTGNKNFEDFSEVMPKGYTRSKEPARRSVPLSVTSQQAGNPVEKDAENVSLVAPSQPIFKSNRELLQEANARASRPILTQRQDLIRSPPYASQYEPDDVTPLDSISNVILPPVRASDYELLFNRPPPRVRAVTEVDQDYTREKYFDSLDQQRTYRYALPTPHPKKDTATEISRMLKGEYYDRRTGQKYEYNINFSPNKVTSERRPYG